MEIFAYLNFKTLKEILHVQADLNTGLVCIFGIFHKIPKIGIFHKFHTKLGINLFCGSRSQHTNPELLALYSILFLNSEPYVVLSLLIFFHSDPVIYIVLRTSELLA